jgi:nicotinamidase-related amidase
MTEVIIGIGLQRSYFHTEGNRYLGDKADILKIRLEDFFRRVPSTTTIYYAREIHHSNDSFYRSMRSYALVGTPDIEIVEALKTYPKFIVNMSRHSAFYMTPLEAELRKIGAKTITVVGVETHAGVLFTVEELRNRDYEVIVPEALVAAEDDYMHAVGINIMCNALSAHVE